MIKLTPKKSSEKVLALMWLLIPIVVLGGSALGWWIGDFWGALLVSFLPASLLTVIAALVATVVETPIRRFSKRGWIAVAVMALFVAIMFASQSLPDAAEGAETILAYVMLIMAFPLALLAPFVLMEIAHFWTDGGHFIALGGMWLTFFVTGYLQWFTLMPWLCRKWKATRAAHGFREKS